MVSYLPIPGGHIKLAERFVDPALSFAIGWNYWYTLIILISFWNKIINPAVWVAMCLVVVIGINALGAGN
jgi:amino acid transporter